MENNDLMHSMSGSEERNWALFSHLGMLASWLPFGNMIMPLIIWQINRDKSEYISEHAKEALNFQITMTIIYIGCALLCIVLIGIPMLIFAVLVDFICSVKGAIKAGRGEYYDYPINFRIIK